MKTKIINIEKKDYFPFILSILFCLAFLVMSLNFFDFLFFNLAEKLLGRPLRDYTKWSRVVKNVLHIPFFILAIHIFQKYFCIGQNLSKEIKSIFKEFTNYLKSRKTLLLFFSVILFYFAAYYKVIDANYYYEDDIARNYDGDRAWISFGRFISEFLSPFIHTTINLTDIAPLTQFISIIFMSFTTILISYSLIKEKTNIFSCILLGFIFISPFYAQCFSYRFDNPYMALAVLFSVLPFLFKDNKKTFFYTSVISLILTCMCYQSGTSVYIMFVIFISLDKILNKSPAKESLLFIFISIFAYIAGLLLYDILFMSKPNPIYVDPNASYFGAEYFDTAISFSAIIPNLKKYTHIVFNETFGLWIKITFIFSLFLFIFGQVKKSAINKMLSLLFVITFLFLAFILSFGPYIAFTSSLFAPRTYMGINAFMALVLFYSYMNIPKNIYKKTFYIPYLVIYGGISFLFTYGNALAQQKEYANFRIQNLIDDLSEISQNTQMTINFSGKVDYCKTLQIAIKKYPVIKQLIPTFPCEGFLWNADSFYSYNFVFDEEPIQNRENMPLLKETYYHDIYGGNNNFYIILKETNECL